MSASARERQYRKEKVKRVFIELYPTDTDIVEWLNKVAELGEGKATYIKRLIREDMAYG